MRYVQVSGSPGRDLASETSETAEFGIDVRERVLPIGKGRENRIQVPGRLNRDFGAGGNGA